ncbi:MAG: hypothetical protein JNM56_33780 [Planctomycetia bacterium]|nr:hypothetical protein [Planctomycetia bacterium]
MTTANARVPLDINISRVDQQARQHWFSRWRRHYGLPDFYCVLDVATTGLDPAEDLIVELGLCCVHRGAVQIRVQLPLNWTKEATIDQPWLRRRLARTAEAVERSRGRPTSRKYPFDYESLADAEQSPQEALDMFWGVIEPLQDAGCCFVAHNGWAFDLPFLAAHFQRWLSRTWKVPENQFLDLAVLEKASQCDVFPWEDESLSEFWERARQSRQTAVHWSLYEHCLPTFRLRERHDLSGLLEHHAGFDAYLGHLLLEDYCRWATGDRLPTGVAC